MKIHVVFCFMMKNRWLLFVAGLCDDWNEHMLQQGNLFYFDVLHIKIKIIKSKIDMFYLLIVINK